eukprot:2909786-Prymnesium_polylepis.1
MVDQPKEERREKPEPRRKTHVEVVHGAPTVVHSDQEVGEDGEVHDIEDDEPIAEQPVHKPHKKRPWAKARAAGKLYRAPPPDSGV